MDNHELAHALFPKRDEGAPRILYGKAVSDSKDGVVSVDVGGQVMQMPTNGNIKRGERTTVTVQDGMVAALGAQGAGDRVQEDVEGAKSAADAASESARNAYDKANATTTLIRQDAKGVTVGKSADGRNFTTGRTTLGDDGLHVLDKDGNETASFTSDTVSLGAMSEKAQIKLCKESGQISLFNDRMSLSSPQGATLNIFDPGNKDEPFTHDTGMGVIVDSQKGDLNVIQGRTTINGYVELSGVPLGKWIPILDGYVYYARILGACVVQVLNAHLPGGWIRNDIGKLPVTIPRDTPTIQGHLAIGYLHADSETAIIYVDADQSIYLISGAEGTYSGSVVVPVM